MNDALVMQILCSGHYIPDDVRCVPDNQYDVATMLDYSLLKVASPCADPVEQFPTSTQVKH